jgi:Flp pilus assembly protein TadD
LHLSAQFAPAAVNLADLYRQLGRHTDATEVLRTAIIASPRDAELHHALGLSLVRLRRNDEALAALRAAMDLAPASARYAYVYAVALQSNGQVADAMAVLEQNILRHPANRDTLTALITYSRDSGDAKSALRYADRLAQLTPSDKSLAKLVDELKRQVGDGGN